ncbi:CaiB/BaiF CoA transferase family protein [Candidimonas nitroreducens]|uniref:Formyl-CoA transferase n=1 Tax=Candidimonas nitroreducens TaxID=683354 RepID=A0A225MK59_9BURK|nr:CoA transferase [Candidimonas nitroreducens]OWT61696.1 formyl-CoA transferase [Candidimonas nitroreducens]
MVAPLRGIRVLDLTHGVAGPYCTMTLGDLGAEIIKIEKPGRGDPTRAMNGSERFIDKIPEVGGDYFLAINRNKRSIGLNLKNEAGKDVCKDLARNADVVVQNFRPGVLKRLGLGYEELRQINPKIIVANISAYGDGALADKPGMDVAVQARSGVMRLTGAIDSKEPVKPAVSLADFGGGIFLAAGVLAALYEREKMGVGREVDVSLIDATMSMLSNYAVMVMDGHLDLKPLGSGHPQLVPYQAFPTSDGHVVISAGTNRIFRDVCAAVGLPELGEDPRFVSNQDRVRNRDVLIGLLSDVLVRRTTRDWIRLFEIHDVPCAPVNDMKTAFEQLQQNSPGMIQTVAHSSGGDLHLLGTVFRFDGEREPVYRAPPMLAQHTEEILAEVLGYETQRIERLKECAAI